MSDQVPAVEMSTPLTVRTLRQWRRRRGMSQQSLAMACGHSVGTISTIERGINTAPDVATMAHVAKALGVGLTQIREFENACNAEG